MLTLSTGVDVPAAAEVAAHAAAANSDKIVLFMSCSLLERYVMVCQAYALRLHGGYLLS